MPKDTRSEYPRFAVKTSPDPARETPVNLNPATPQVAAKLPRLAPQPSDFHPKHRHAQTDYPPASDSEALEKLEEAEREAKRAPN